MSNRAHLIFPYPSRTRKIGGSGARAAQDWHDFARNRSSVRRQNGAARAARLRFGRGQKDSARKLERDIEEKDAFSRAAYGQALDTTGIFELYRELAEKIRGFVTDTSSLVNRALAEGKSMLFEGAQGTMLDIDHGTYPFVTSSSAIAGGACTGLGVAPTQSYRRDWRDEGLHDSRGRRALSDGDAGPGRKSRARPRK